MADAPPKPTDTANLDPRTILIDSAELLFHAYALLRGEIQDMTATRTLTSLIGLGLFSIAAFAATPSLAAGEGAQWGARDPVLSCPEIDSEAAPSADQITSLLRCEKEEITASDELWLLEEVEVRIGKAREHLGINELMTMPDSDTAKPVYPLRGSWTWVICRDPKAVQIGGGDPTVNCSQARVAKAEGACWMTTFGTWRCNMTGPAAAAVAGSKPPQQTP